MKFSFQATLFVCMIVVGAICGVAFYLLVIPFYGNSLSHCILMGVIFGFINYLVSYKIYTKYALLKESNEKMQQDLMLDKLTGLYNRRAFDINVEKMPDDMAYSMIFIDIDNFRTFNNNFGHSAGDTVLKKVSLAIKSSIRCNDKVYRYGGEEIVVVLIDCTKENAFNIAEKIRLAVNCLDNSPYPRITVSLGVSSYLEDGKNIVKIIESCDDALLTAKRQGKNQTYVCSDVPSNFEN